MIQDCDNSFEKKLDNNSLRENSTENNSEIKCRECQIKEVNYLKNKFIISNNNEPEQIFDDYDSYKEEYIDKKNTNKICNNYYCKTINNILHKCEKCKKLFCEACKYEHKKAYNHENFEKTEIMDEDEKQKYDNIIKDIKKALEKVENIKKHIEEMAEKYNNCLNCFVNYLEDYKSIIENMTLYNFEIYNKKFSNINNILEQINQSIEKSFLNICENIEKNKYITLINDRYLKLKEEHLNQESDSEDTTDSKYVKEIKKLDKNEVEIKCFSAFKDNTYMLTGTKTGEIEIYDLPDKNSYKIQNFFGQEEVEYICNLGNNYFAASDGKRQIKIIEFEEKELNLKEIQTIYINERINSMIFLSKFSQIKNNNLYFCISKGNKIEVYQSFVNENQPLEFKLNESIELNTIAKSIIEVSEKYLVAACPEEKTVIFFDMQDNFKKDKKIKDIKLTSGKNIFSIVYKNRFLNVACEDGFKLIYIKDRKLYKSIHCRYSTLCVETLDEDSFICCCLDQNKNKIKKYKIIKEKGEAVRYMFEKVGDIENDNDEEIWEFKKINDVVYYIDNQNKLNERITITC